MFQDKKQGQPPILPFYLVLWYILFWRKSYCI